MNSYFTNIYVYVGNRPADTTDHTGKGPVAVAVAAVMAGAVACAAPFAWYAAEGGVIFGLIPAGNGFPGSSPAFKHCWVGCASAKVCGAALANLAGLMNEVGDQIREQAKALVRKQRPDLWWMIDSIDDLIVNNVCMGIETYLGIACGWVGCFFREKCESCCRREIGYTGKGPINTVIPRDLVEIVEPLVLGLKTPVVKKR